MILETIVSTVDRDGVPNFAPMGIRLEGEEVVLRPFPDARTFQNLEVVREGVVHFTDDVLLFARSAVTDHLPPHRPAARVRAPILEDACSWKEFVVTVTDRSDERAVVRGRVVAEGRGREFLGFNRASHAVIEASILATRVHLLGRERVLDEMARLRPLVDKTGGPRERQAFDLLLRRVEGEVHAP
jgi:hypothetical protein